MKAPSTNKIVLALTCSLLLLTALGCSRLTQENFNKVETGMTYEQVVGILGEPTDNKSVGAGPVSASSVSWESDSARVNIKFLNNKVQLKAFESKEKGGG